MTVPFSTYTDTPLVDIYGAVSISNDPASSVKGTLNVAGSAVFASALVGSSGATFTGGAGLQSDQSGGGQSATAVAVATSGTVSTVLRVSRINPAAAVTSCVMQQGTFPGQTVFVVNEGVAGSSLTFAASASSNVASGAVVIGGLVSKAFVWDSVTSLWY